MLDRQDGCEYVFIWRTSEACPIRKSQGKSKAISTVKLHQRLLWSCKSRSKLFLPGENCRVRDPKSGYVFDFSSLKGRDYPIQSGKYTYHLSICGALEKDVCTHKDTGIESVSSCQVEGDNQKIAGIKNRLKENPKTAECFDLCVVFLCLTFLCVWAGMANQVLSFVGDQIILNYTSGETCHTVYQRSTEISFSCHPDRHPVSVTGFWAIDKDLILNLRASMLKMSESPY